MKNLRGLIVSAVICLLTVLLYHVAADFDVLLEMAYPFFSKTVMEMIGGFTAGADFCVWQVALAVYLVAVVASLTLVLLLRGNVLRWLGIVLVPVTLAGFLLCGVWGLNFHNKPLTDSMKLEVEQNYSLSAIREAAMYYRTEAEKLCGRVPRDENNDLYTPDLEIMNRAAAKGYDKLVWKYSIFAGPRTPVKTLGWSSLYTKLGVEGITVGLTGEAAINPEQYGASLPFSVCQESARLLAFARKDEVSFAAYLACEQSGNNTMRYSGYLNAFLYCSNTLYERNKLLWAMVWEDADPLLRHDAEAINDFAALGDRESTEQIDAIYGAYLAAIGEEEGKTTDSLVAWYNTWYRPVEEEPEEGFDPTDYDWVFPPATEP